jgi:hypothetical protein
VKDRESEHCACLQWRTVFGPGILPFLDIIFRTVERLFVARRFIQATIIDQLVEHLCGYLRVSLISDRPPFKAETPPQFTI